MSISFCRKSAPSLPSDGFGVVLDVLVALDTGEFHLLVGRVVRLRTSVGACNLERQCSMCPAFDDNQRFGSRSLAWTEYRRGHSKRFFIYNYDKGEAFVRMGDVWDAHRASWTAVWTAS